METAPRFIRISLLLFRRFSTSIRFSVAFFRTLVNGIQQSIFLVVIMLKRFGQVQD